MATAAGRATDVEDVRIEPEGLNGFLGVPEDAKGLVIFAHGSGSGRFSPRNNEVAAGLRDAGLATLLLDLLRPEEEADRANVFDIRLLAQRLVAATAWAEANAKTASLAIGYFGASTGAAAALSAAAELGNRIAAVVSRGGRPDLAADKLAQVRAAVLLIVGGADTPVIPLNRMAFERLKSVKRLEIVEGAGHLFEEAGTLQKVTALARAWFLRFLSRARGALVSGSLFSDRADAGHKLAQHLLHLKDDAPIVLALPRGGVPVAFEIAKVLSAPLDLLLVRKIGAPFQPELGLGAVVDGASPQVVLNEEVMAFVQPDPRYVDEEVQQQLQELERRRTIYLGARPAPAIEGRTVIVVDDGIATGGTMRAVLTALARLRPKHLVLAVPVAPPDTLNHLAPLADEVVCLSTPENFYAVGMHYADFSQTSDEEVIDLLARASKTQRASAPQPSL